MQSETMFKTFPRNHIDKIYKSYMKASDGAFSTMMVDNLAVKTAVDLPKRRILFELLQNANDARASNVIISLKNNYLLFANNGKELNCDDVNKLCCMHSSEKTGKQVNANTTGYKDIGFKTTFALSDCVYVFANPDSDSEGYSFRFDKSRFLGKDLIKRPWQIIPIQNDADDLQVLPEEFNYSLVNVVLRLNTEEDITTVQEVIKLIVDSPEALLFLSNLKKLQINGQHVIELSKRQAKITIKINGVLHGEWRIYRYTIDVPEEIKEWVRKVSIHICPQKMKDEIVKQGEITIKYVVKFENGIPVPIVNNNNNNKNNVIYCCLPTEVSFSFKFSVDANFLLNTNRTKLLENSLNAFLLEKISEYHFLLLVKIASQPKWRSQVLNFLCDKELHNISSQQFRNSFADGFKRGVENYAFLPAMFNRRKLLKLNEAYLDTIGFHQFFSEEFSTESLSDKYATEIIADLENQEKLIDLGIKQFTICEFLLEIERYAVQTKFDPHINLKLFAFIYKNWCIFVNKLWELKYKKIILTKDYKLRQPSQLYLYPQDNKYITPGLIKILKIEFVNQELFKGQKSNAIRQLLITLGVRGYNHLEIVKREILPLINKRKIDKGNSIPIITFLCRIYTNNELNGLQLQEISELSRIKIISMKDKLILIRNSYLPNDLNLALPLEKIIKKDIFISSKYYINSKIDKQVWKNFFIWLGAKQTIELQVIKEYKRGNIVEDFTSNIENSYFNYLTRKFNTPTKKDPRKQYVYKDNHIIENWLCVDYMDRCLGRSAEYDKQFWRIFISKWDEIRSMKVYYKSPKGKFEIESYLQYILQHNSVIKATDNKRYKSTEVYISNQEALTNCKLLPTIQNFVRNNLPLFFYSDMKFSSEQIAFLGFKEQLDMMGCIRLLESLKDYKGELNLVKAFTVIFRIIISLKPTEDDVEALRSADILLLAENNTLQTLANLCYFDSRYGGPPVDSAIYLKKLPKLSDNKMQKICKIFSIVPRQNVKKDLIPIDAVEITGLKEIILERLPALGLLVGHNQSYGSAELHCKLLKSLYAKISGLKFYRIKFYTRNNEIINEIEYQDQVRIEDNCCYLMIEEQENCYACIDSTLEPISQHIVDYLDLGDIVSAKEIRAVLSPKDLKTLNHRLKLQKFLTGQKKNIYVEIKQCFTRLQAAPISEPIFSSKISSAFPKKEKVVMPDKQQYQNAELQHKQDQLEESQTLLKEPQFKDEVKEKESFLPLKDSNFMPSYKPNLDSVVKRKSGLKKPRSKAKTKKETSDASKKPPKYTEDDQKMLGRLGEKYVYSQLYKHYAKKYKVTPTKTEKSFKLTANKNKKINLELIWPNKGLPYTEDVGKHFDMKIIKNGVERYIEVKATVPINDTKIYLSPKEWELAQEFGDRYRIFRVFQVPDPSKSKAEIPILSPLFKQTFFRKYKNPAAMFSNGEIKPSSALQLRLPKPKLT